MKRRSSDELYELIEEALIRKLDREITAMAFKGSKPGKGSGDGKGGKDQADVLAMYRELVRIQSEVIHALAAALGSTEADEDDEDENEEEENDEEKEDK